jgi:hypothetical protein
VQQPFFGSAFFLAIYNNYPFKECIIRMSIISNNSLNSLQTAAQNDFPNENSAAMNIYQTPDKKSILLLPVNNYEL